LDNKFRGILAGLSDYTPVGSGDRDLLVEARAVSAIAAIRNVLRLIEDTYDEETSADLTKRLINAARTGDEEKFRRKTRQLRKERQREKGK